MLAIKRTEKIVKGFANHHRIRILLLLESEPGLTLTDITEKLRVNLRTSSEHTRKLAIAPG